MNDRVLTEEEIKSHGIYSIMQRYDAVMFLLCGMAEEKGGKLKLQTKSNSKFEDVYFEIKSTETEVILTIELKNNTLN